MNQSKQRLMLDPLLVKKCFIQLATLEGRVKSLPSYREKVVIMVHIFRLFPLEDIHSVTQIHS